MSVSFCDVILNKGQIQNAIWERKSRMKDKNVFLLHFKFKMESCSFQSDAMSLSVYKSFQTLCLLLSYRRLFVQEVFLCLGLCISESLSGSYALMCNCLKLLSCLQVVLVIKRA